MSDIVDRLREQGEWRNDKAWDGCPIAEEAAKEITRLREENARLRAVIQFILDNQISERRSEHIDCVIIHGEPIRAARAAILGKVKAEAACPAPDEAL